LKKGLATQIVNRIIAAETELGALNVLSEQIAEEQERLAFRRQLAGVMALYIDMLMSIVREHPELDPDKPRRQEDRTGGQEG
jgi:hypothetical protein